MATIYGIDTGSWRVRIAATEGSFRRFDIRDAAQVAVLLDDAGQPRTVDALSTLRADEPGWDAAEKVAAVPLDAAVVRLVRLPFSDRNAIARALPAEVESQVPYDLEDMVMGTRIVDAREGGSRTTVFIAPRDDLSARIEMFQKAHAEPRLMCVDADALSAYADRGVQVVVDVGHRRTLLTFCENGKVLAGRFVATGGAEFTEAVARALALGFDEAEARKHEMSLPLGVGEASAGWAEEERTDASRPVPGRAEQALAAAVDDWCAEVRAELIALEDELGLGVDDLLICGGSARLAGLGERLASRTGVPARAVVVPGGHGVEYALAVALARVGAGEVPAVDLRTGDLAYHGTAESMWNAMVYMGVGGTVAAVAAVALFTMQYLDTLNRLAELDQKIGEAVVAAFPDVSPDRLEEPSMALAIMQEKTAETSARVDTLGATVSGVPPTLETLKAISAGVPPPNEARIDVRELTISQANISFKAETDSYDSAARIEAALQRDARFKSARKADEKKTGEALTFTVNIPLDGATTDGEEG